MAHRRRGRLESHYHAPLKGHGNRSRSILDYVIDEPFRYPEKTVATLRLILDAEPNNDEWNQKTFLFSSEEGYDEFVKRLSSKVKLADRDAGILAAANEIVEVPISKPHETIVLHLLKTGVSPYASSGALGIVLGKDYLRYGRKLIEAGADPNGQDASGKTPLIFTCLENAVESSKALIEDYKVDAAKTDENGYHALAYAVVNASKENVALLADLTDLSKTIGTDGDTLMTLAGKQLLGFPKQVHTAIVMEAIADAYEVSKKGKKKYGPLKEFLNQTNNEGFTVLDYVVKEVHRLARTDYSLLWYGSKKRRNYIKYLFQTYRFLMFRGAETRKMEAIPNEILSKVKRPNEE